MIIERVIRHYIVASILDWPGFYGDPLAEGVVDSLGLEELISFVEDRYRIQLSDGDLGAADVASVGALADLVRQKRGRRSVRWTPGR